MTRRTAFVLILHLPLWGCAKPAVHKPRPSASAAPAPDRRPDVGRAEVGDDITALVRQENSPGDEPPLPTRKGVVTPGRPPRIERTKQGFVAHVGSRNVATPAYHRGRIFGGGYGTYEMHAISAETGRPSSERCRLHDGLPVSALMACISYVPYPPPKMRPR